MIFPFIRLWSVSFFPTITVLLALFNVSIYFYNVESQTSTEELLRFYMKDSAFLKQQGKVYYNHVENQTDLKNDIPLQVFYLHTLVSNGQLDKLKDLGAVSFRDAYFLEVATKYDDALNPHEFNLWKEKFNKTFDLLKSRPSQKFGLLKEWDNWRRYLTYQFIHAGSVHLMVNLIVLLVVGITFEYLVGHFWFLVTYILGGVVAGAVFTLSIKGGYSPLVGASGAISAIAAALATIEGRRSIPFYYFFLPIQSMFGIVYLPAYTILLVMFSSDLVQLIVLDGISQGIAFSAHIAGAVFGGVMGFLLRPIRTKTITHSVFGEFPGVSKQV